MRPLATSDEQVAFWRSHARQGIGLCLLLPLAVLVDVALSPAPAHPVALCAVSGITAALALLILLIPMEKVVRHPCGRLFFDVWDGAGLAIISVLALLDGGIGSPYLVFFYILLAHAAMAYPPAGTAIAGGVAITCYLTVGLVTGGAGLDGLVTGSFTLAVATGTCAFASWNQVRAHEKTKALAEQLAELADRDGLTDLLNHRAFHHRLGVEMAGAAVDHPLSVVLVDVDEFKTVNDTYGHLAGDAVLRLVAGVMAAAVGSDSHAGRLGGDEFALLLPATTGDEAMEVARLLCLRVHAAGDAYGVSLSAGVATASGGDVTALLAEADAAVYEAKRTGRDRATHAPAQPSPDRRRVPSTGCGGSPAPVVDLAG